MNFSVSSIIDSLIFFNTFKSSSETFTYNSTNNLYVGDTLTIRRDRLSKSMTRATRVGTLILTTVVTNELHNGLSLQVKYEFHEKYQRNLLHDHLGIPRGERIKNGMWLRKVFQARGNVFKKKFNLSELFIH